MHEIGKGTGAIDLTGMIVLSFSHLGVEIAVLVTLRVSREENGENGNF